MFRGVVLAAIICLAGTRICVAASLVTAPPVPQPTRPGDLVGLVFQNASDGRSGAKLITFGQIFARGQVANNDAIAALIGGTTEPVQTDVKSTYADGSVRFAVLTMSSPPLAARQMISVMLKKAANPEAGSVDIEHALAAHDIDIALHLTATGDPAVTGQTTQEVTLDAAAL